MYKFTKTHSDWRSPNTILESVTVELHRDSDMVDLLDAFHRFLKAAGFGLDNSVLVCQEEEDSEELESRDERLREELHRVLTTLDHPELAGLRQCYEDCYGEIQEEQEVLHDE